MTDIIAQSLAALGSAKLNGLGQISRVPKVSFHGDSIGLLMGNFEPASPFFWALVRQPRALELVYNGVTTNTTGPNFSVSGSVSGPLYAGLNRTSTLLQAASANDMNDATRLAGIAAYAADDMFIEIGSNESALAAAADATILNVKDVINANPNPNKRIIIISTFPKTNTDRHVLNFNRWAEQMARNYPNYYFLDTRIFGLDSASTTGAALTVMSSDGVHPNSVLARQAAAAVSNLFDKLGYQKISPRGVNALDVYNATNNLGGNLLGTIGNMTGTTGTLGANVTGTLPTGWNASTTNAELTAVASIGTLNDARGNAKRYTTFTFSGAGNLTAGRNFSFFVNGSNVQQAKKLYTQALAQFANLVGCWGIGLTISSTNAPTVTARYGYGGNSVVAPLPTSATAEHLDMVNPNVFIPDPSNNSTFQITLNVQFLAGYTPAGTVSFADVGFWDEVAVP